MLANPSYLNKLSKGLQTRINSYIPEKVHAAITTAIRQMIRAVLFGYTYTTSAPFENKSLELREAIITERLNCHAFPSWKY